MLGSVAAAGELNEWLIIILHLPRLWCAMATGGSGEGGRWGGLEKSGVNELARADRCADKQLELGSRFLRW